jgi:chromosome segregation ATPase
MTFSELQQAAATLPARIAAAVYDGDETALGRLEQERAALPARLFAAELRELQLELAGETSELQELRVEEAAQRANVAECLAAVKTAQHELQLAQREAGQVANRVSLATDNTRRIRARIAELTAQQAYLARAASAPVVRNLVGHIPAPIRWPQ